ncbi:hypothetical protein C3F09_08250 [candidate division GN15 bacterium]|uniref:Uncharacterized protein n=1 Tax=candidate division GN15 bacterium TaxID=2072418 RepID=A0A855X1L9_9BACT|nr:MAG: hypothetical protein C3F09_08250 [candidate division GN15 bacterium]
MKRLTVSIASVLLIFAVGAYAQGMQGMQGMQHNSKAQANAEPAKEVTVQGEIVDMGCYLSSDAHGMGHQSCAEKCLSNGMPMGLLTKDGTLYLLTVSHGNADPFNQAKQWAAEQVIVTGPEFRRNGMKAVEVDQVRQVNATEKPTKQG